MNTKIHASLADRKTRALEKALDACSRTHRTWTAELATYQGAGWIVNFRSQSRNELMCIGFVIKTPASSIARILDGEREKPDEAL